MIGFSCAQCGMKLKVKDEFAGRRSTCPTCKQPLIVPPPDRTQANLPAERIDGLDSSLGRAGIEVGVTLATESPSAARSGRLPVRELINRRGKTRERYVIESEIARGGMGAVLRAVDCDIRREVAVKYLLDQADPHKKSRFVEEAQITGQLEHPNIVPIHELGIDGQKRLFFAMKMVRGRSLAQVVDELRQNPKTAEKEYPLARLLNVFVNVCNALAYAHSCGVVHRDLKPANIMVGDFGEVYVMDWGLAKVLASGGREPPEDVAVTVNASSSGGSRPSLASNSKVQTHREIEADLTQEGAVLGTPAYMPPEQAAGHVNEIDQRSDVYSLGAVLYEMLTLQPPINKEGGYLAMLMRVAAGEIVPPQQRAPERARQGKVPRELSAIALKAMAKLPQDRYPDVTALRRDIERFQEGRSVSAKEDTFREAAWKLMKRNQLASAFLILLAGVVCWSFWSNWQARRKTDEAYQSYRDEVKKSVPAFVQAAHLWTERGNLGEALNQVDIALKADPEDAPAHLLKAQLLIIRQEYAGARAELEHYLQLRSSDVEARKLMELCRTARAQDFTTTYAFADIFRRQNADTLVQRLYESVTLTIDARKKLLPAYQKQIDAAWPGLGSRLTLDSNSKFSFSLESGAKPISDLSPLRGLPLTTLNLERCGQLRDLAPLKNMPLTSLRLWGCAQVRDLTPLKGMQLTYLDLTGCSLVRDLMPLQHMPLSTLSLTRCEQVQDLTPLRGLPLTTLHLGGCAAKDLTPLHTLPLATLSLSGRDDLTLLQGLPLTTLRIDVCGAADLTPLRGMKLTQLSLFRAERLTDLSPLRDMPLHILSLEHCSLVRDLTPLRGLPLASLLLEGCAEVQDLSPLKGVPLTSLSLSACGRVRDLTPLAGMKLVSLTAPPMITDKDLTLLKGLPLDSLSLRGCGQVRDLEALQGMKLTGLDVSFCSQLHDLTAVKGLPLHWLYMDGSPGIQDLTPLEGLPLFELRFTPRHISRGLEVVRKMKNLRWIGTTAGQSMPPEGFWRRYDSGEFSK